MRSLQKLVIILLVFAGKPSFLFACGNEYYSTPEIPFAKGKLVLRELLEFPHDNTYPYWHHGFGENIGDRYYDLGRKIDPIAMDSAGTLDWGSIERALAKGKDYKLLSDYAWYALRVGNKENAVRLLERLYQLHPNEYNVLANLGTAYEVTGKNEKALELLRKAVALNPASHHGSEWIHLKILEQKIKSSPDYKAILDLDSGNDYEAWTKGVAYNKTISADSLMTQLAYQLHERISFVPKPDAVVGQLVVDFADLTTITQGPAKALEFYNYALSYDSSLANAIKTRIGVSDGERVVNKTVTVVEEKSAVNKWLYIGVGGLLVAALLFFSLRKKRLIK